MVYFNLGKHYTHYNRSLGKHIRNKAHYDDELKRGGYVSYEDGCAMADLRQSMRADYKPSKKVHEMVEACKDHKGVPGRVVDAMVDMGVCIDKEKIEKHIERGMCL